MDKVIAQLSVHLVFSAGVNRTGVFIALLSQLTRIEKEGNISIFDFVRAMRYRRKFMVPIEVCHLIQFIITLIIMF